MPRRHRADKRRGITNAQRSDLWLGPSCYRDHRMFGGVWCECSPFSSPADRERAFWSLPEEERRHYVALYDYDERFREATEEAVASGCDPVLVEIEEFAGDGAVARIASARSPRFAACSMAASESLYRSRTTHSD